MTDRWGTHPIELRPTTVVKRFRAEDARARLEREWRPLNLLAGVRQPVRPRNPPGRRPCRVEPGRQPHRRPAGVRQPVRAPELACPTSLPG